MSDEILTNEAQEDANPVQESEESTVVNEEPKPKQTRRTRKKKAPTMRDELKASFKNAPADLINHIESRVGSDTKEGIAAMNPSTVNSNIQAAVYRYVNEVIGGKVNITRTLENELREYAEARNINYDSLFTHRGKPGLTQAIREVTGNVDASTLAG